MTSESNGSEPHGSESHGPESHHAEFERHRDRLFGLAYRLTGSVADAEDACQDAWLRWSRQDPNEIRQPEAFLVTTTTRICLDRLGSAARRRETYVGPFLPEPRVSPHTVDPPAEAMELADSMTLAFLVLLDQLSPSERAAFLLHDVFGYPFAEVATILDRSAESARQLASRARRRIDPGRREYRSAQHEADLGTVSAFVAAIAGGDVDAALKLLAPDVVHLSDGGPHRRAARRPVIGPDRVVRLWTGLVRQQHHDVSVETVSVNGLPGLLLREHGRPTTVVEIAVLPDGRIHRITAQMNPDKLAHLR